MTEKPSQPNILRYIAAVILGCIVGAILFLVVALFIGYFNDMAHMKIPINMMVAENIFSAALLAVLVIISVGFFCWKVRTTPPTQEETEPEE